MSLEGSVGRWGLLETLGRMEKLLHFLAFSFFLEGKRLLSSGDWKRGVGEVTVSTGGKYLLLGLSFQQNES